MKKYFSLNFRLTHHLLTMPSDKFQDKSLSSGLCTPFLGSQQDSHFPQKFGNKIAKTRILKQYQTPILVKKNTCLKSEPTMTVSLFELLFLRS
jgi:hypothetical protein